MIVPQRGRWLAGSVCFLLPLVALPSIEQRFTTVASWYGPGFQGQQTASGQRFDQEQMTAASRTLPFGTKLLVQNPHNGRSCNVVINDRGPFIRGRGLDLSHAAARHLGISGIGPVVCFVQRGSEHRYRHIYSAPEITPGVDPKTIAYNSNYQTGNRRNARKSTIAWQAATGKAIRSTYARRSAHNVMPPTAPPITPMVADRTWNDSSYIANAPEANAPSRRMKFEHAVGRLTKKLAHVDKFLGSVLASL